MVLSKLGYFCISIWTCSKFSPEIIRVFHKISFAFTYGSAPWKLLLFVVYNARGIPHIKTNLCPFPILFPHLLLLFPRFSFLKTRLVWFCLNLVISAFQFELVPSFPLKLYESFTKFTLHLLLVMLPKNSLCLLSTMPVAYCKSRLIYALFLTYFRPYYCFSLVSPFWKWEVYGVV